MMPMPPWRAMAMARFDSVTVSIAAEASGMLSESLRVKQVRVSTSVGKIEDLPGKQKHVVECKTFGNGTVDHSDLISWEWEAARNSAAQRVAAGPVEKFIKSKK